MCPVCPHTNTITYCIYHSNNTSWTEIHERQTPPQRVRLEMQESTEMSHKTPGTKFYELMREIFDLPMIQTTSSSVKHCGISLRNLACTAASGTVSLIFIDDITHNSAWLNYLGGGASETFRNISNVMRWWKSPSPSRHHQPTDIHSYMRWLLFEKRA